MHYQQNVFVYYIYSCKSMLLILYSFVLSLSSKQQPKSGLINLTLTRKEANFVLNALNNSIHTYEEQPPLDEPGEKYSSNGGDYVANLLMEYKKETSHV